MGTPANGPNQTPCPTRPGVQRPIIPGQRVFVIALGILAPRKVGHVLEVSAAVCAVVLLEGIDDELPGRLGQDGALATHIGGLDPQGTVEAHLGGASL